MYSSGCNCQDTWRSYSNIGKDAATVKEIETLGARHQMALQTQVVVDEKNMIFSTPCYMLDATIVDIAEGAKAIVSEMLKWI